ncbi:glycosyltransferase involved in cell wall biosynthesis [Pseudobacter ginsenosidimutans]|uniref:Glycosyltransferase involved in cell wall biosynthesis n=2 Tax=Pseudobacter ginsenosidimutans TaxID=661488 RepID=A0A4Q7N186_9BACT|nr:glycosyltransferase involved in cell wall biosynthesis [Pseudobacter ginsenosidimutans]
MVASQPVVSIITAFYNTGEIFLETLYSILHQTYSNFEWLIINDCSTNSISLQLLNDAAQSDPRIRVINNTANIGLALTRNHGVQHAKGNYLFFIDSDDMVEFSYLEKCLLCLELNPHFSFVSSHTIGFDAKEYVWAHGYLQPERFLADNYAVNCYVCRRSVFDQIQYENIKGGMEDWDFWLHAASIGLWGYTIPEFLYWYRERNNRSIDWPDIFDAGKRQAFIGRLHEKYAKKLASLSFNTSLSKERHQITNIQQANLSGSGGEHILFLLNYQPEDNQQLITCDYLRFFQSQGASITILIHHLESDHYDGDFSGITDDVFIADHLCAVQNRQSIWQYLITSRNIQRVIAINLPADPEDLPLIKSAFPHLQADLILLSLPKQFSVDNLIQRYHLDTAYIDHIGAGAQEIRFILETNAALYGKVYFMPPVSQQPVQPFSLRQVQQQKNEWGINSGTFTISFTGRIGNEHFKWLRALISKLKTNEHNHCLFILRVWERELKLLRESITPHELSGNLRLLPVNPQQPELQEALAIADCYLDISALNGLNDALREALRLGIPVLSIGNEGIKDLIDPQTGSRFRLHYKDPEKQAADLIATITELAKNTTKMNRLRNSCLQKATAVLAPTHPSAVQFYRLEKNVPA